MLMYYNINKIVMSISGYQALWILLEKAYISELKWSVNNTDQQICWGKYITPKFASILSDYSWFL